MCALVYNCLGFTSGRVFTAVFWGVPDYLSGPDILCFRSFANCLCPSPPSVDPVSPDDRWALMRYKKAFSIAVWNLNNKSGYMFQYIDIFTDIGYKNFKLIILATSYGFVFGMVHFVVLKIHTNNLVFVAFLFHDTLSSFNYLFKSTISTLSALPNG